MFAAMPRPPFFPPPFLPHPVHPFMMGPRLPMGMGMPGPHGMISPIGHMMTNGSGGGSDANSFEIVDSANITPNSTSYDPQINGSAASPTPEGKVFSLSTTERKFRFAVCLADEQQPATTKTKKVKKTVKKKSKTPTTATATTAVAADTSTSMTREDV